jgi:hypothetical protein
MLVQGAASSPQIGPCAKVSKLSSALQRIQEQQLQFGAHCRLSTYQELMNASF